VEIQITLDVLRGGHPLGSGGHTQQVPMYVSNGDITFAGAYPVPRLAGGSFSVALRAMWEATCSGPLHIQHYGKPTAATFSYARAALQRWAQRSSGSSEQLPPLQRIWMVGDNPLADIRGANAAGEPWRSVLVRTGVFKGPAGSNDERDPAHVVCEGVGEAVREVLRWRPGGA
jgi:HAD superfamily hydrolase (TIGR01456 family)